MRRSGLALILVAGVLGLLAVLAAAFVTMAQLERRASLQRIHATKALLLARSGIEDALARLGAGQDPDLPGTRYLGEDWNGNGLLDRSELTEEVYRPAALDRESCPVRQALRPSFFLGDSLGQPWLLDVDDRRRGSTGRLASDLAPEGNHYAVKVIPRAGIHVNGGDPAQPPTAGYNAVLRRILGNLAEALDRENGGANDGLPSDEALGWALVDNRPSGGWKDMEALRQWAKAAGPATEAQFLALDPYLTTTAWVDTRTLKPDAAAPMTMASVHTWTEIKQGVDAGGIPTRGMPTIEPRAPVNLAWARRRWPVLVALMGGLKGLYLLESSTNTFTNGQPTDRVGYLWPTDELLLDWNYEQGWGVADPCRQVASALAAYTGPLGTWDEWNAFCDTLTSGMDLSGYLYPNVPAMRSLLKANFNPNSRLNKFNPNRSMWQMVDKQDLLVYSTEFVLEPVHACEVESVGRVLGKDGRLLAFRALRCEIAGPGVARLSTQREFVCSALGSLERSGDETGVRIPGVDSPFLPTSRGPGGIHTWGQDLPGLSGKGVGVQPYPEPYVDLDADPDQWDLTLSPAYYDGSLQSATLETEADDTYTAGSGDMKMLARWTADLDLAVSDAYALAGIPAKRQNQPDVSQGPLSNGLLHPSLPNTLYPDGCYSERDRAPGYFDRDNANGLHGLMTFWMKPNFHKGVYNDCDEPTLAPSISGVPRSHQFVKWSNYFTGPGGGGWGGDSPDQFFALVQTWTAGYGDFACQFEITHTTSDTNREHQFCTPVDTASVKPHRWRLLTFAWDLQAPDQHGTGELVMNDGTGPCDLGSSEAYEDLYGNLQSGNASTAASDLTNDDRFGSGLIAGSWPHLIFLGRRGYRAEADIEDWVGLGADATFDEFAIYDFGPGVGAVGGRAATLSSARFREGRYYKESAYAGLGATPGLNQAARWYSAPIDLGGGRLIALAWTQVLPLGLKSPGDPGEDGRIEMELSDTLTGNEYALDASGRPMDTTFRDSALSRVARTPAGPFRLHAVFRPNLQDKDNNPILDPLVLDDVTLLYAPPGGVPLFGWKDGE